MFVRILITAPIPSRRPTTWGGAILANYAFDSNWSLGGRVEYISQNDGYDAVLYGKNSSAWTITVTPTYQYKVLFARAEFLIRGGERCQPPRLEPRRLPRRLRHGRHSNRSDARYARSRRVVLSS